MKKLLLGLLAIFVVACGCTKRSSEPEEPKEPELILTELQEREACGDDANEGCNADPPSLQDFEYINCNELFYGTSWSDGDIRDTDWYSFTPDTITEVTITVEASFNLRFFLLRPEWPFLCRYTMLVRATSDSSRIWSLTTVLDSTKHFIWIGQKDWEILNCGENDTYWMSLVCSPVTEDSPAMITNEENDFDVSLLRKEK